MKKRTLNSQQLAQAQAASVPPAKPAYAPRDTYGPPRTPPLYVPNQIQIVQPPPQSPPPQMPNK